MKVLFLGASAAQVPIIERALQQGHVVFTTDHLSGNPGHRLAYRSFTANAADAEECTRLATDLMVDGVVGYASEVCARTASRVANALGLPGSPLAGVENLSNKALFRKCMANADLPLPRWLESGSGQTDRDADDFATQCNHRVVVKPVDNSGGRGVSILPRNLRTAIAHALEHSWNGKVILEEYIEKEGSQIGGDAWIEGGRVVFLHTFDNCTLPPPADGAAIQETFPSSRKPDELRALTETIETAVRAAGYHRGPINFDACFTPDGKPMLFEIAPRNAGNRIPVMIQHRTGVDFAQLVLDFSLDTGFRFCPPPAMARPFVYHGIRVLASGQPGTFVGLRFAPTLLPHLLDTCLAVSPGDPVRIFRNAGDSLGTVALQFSSREEMNRIMAGLDHSITIDLQSTIP